MAYLESELSDQTKPSDGICLKDDLIREEDVWLVVSDSQFLHEGLDALLTLIDLDSSMTLLKS
jgi:hypothetical protein